MVVKCFHLVNKESKLSDGKIKECEDIILKMAKEIDELKNCLD